MPHILRITPMIWFGGLYQEPIIPDYEEDTDELCFLRSQEFFSFCGHVSVLTWACCAEYSIEHPPMESIFGRIRSDRISVRIAAFIEAGSLEF